jgi:hypothetical protein
MHNCAVNSGFHFLVCRPSRRKLIYSITTAVFLVSFLFRGTNHSAHKRAWQASVSCGSFAVNVADQVITGVQNTTLCETPVLIGTSPRFLHDLNKGTVLRGGGRKDPYTALDIRKEFPNVHEHPVLSIITSVYNAAPALDLSLPPLFDFTVSPWELVIVLDASYDHSYIKSKDIILDRFDESSCVRARIIVQPTAVWEVSSDNIGMRICDPTFAYVLFQADTILSQTGWDKKMLHVFREADNIFALSGRCGHSLDMKVKIGRCDNAVTTPLDVSSLEADFKKTETVNRGPLMLRSSVTQRLGFLNETRFLLDNDDHDIVLRARHLGYSAGYIPISFHSPSDLSAKRNPKFLSHTPAKIKQQEQRYKEYRIKRGASFRANLRDVIVT